MNNIYSHPEAHGLTTFGEIDFSSGSYEYDLTVVWRRDSDGQFFYSDEAGCSCPEPFDTIGIQHLTSFDSLTIFKAHLAERQSWNEYYDRSLEVANLLDRLHQAGMR